MLTQAVVGPRVWNMVQCSCNYFYTTSLTDWAGPKTWGSPTCSQLQCQKSISWNSNAQEMSTLPWGSFAKWALPLEVTSGSMPSHYVLCLAQPDVNQTSEYCSQLCRSNGVNMYSICLWYHVYLQSSGLWATRIKLFSLTHLIRQMLALQSGRCFPWRICFQYLMMKNCLQRINKCTCMEAPARQKPSISAGTSNDQCLRK